MAAEDRNEQRRTLRDYTIPSTASFGSSIVRPAVEANNFELKPSLIQLVQQEQFYGNSQEGTKLSNGLTLNLMEASQHGMI
ncbi:hypothetical protein PIB30_091154 [Stylosanthes scabra]|uniref:Uncharacterized protein n=1 Tax=Stylosanthes scabra TaxID=79078 RepID=A0ABU6XS43_9FABA|nr:hypothetical protein [Stylosanthes scabra]